MGALLYARRLVVAGEGNLSVKVDDGRYLTTPAGTCKGWLEPDDLVQVDLDGRLHDEAGRPPSSEWLLHREIYRRCPGAGAVCHAHPPYATACGVAGRTLDHRLLAETAMLLGPIPLAAPAVPGTDEVARSVTGHLPDAFAIVLANHGVVAWGRDLVEAYFRLESVERLAEVTVLSDALGGGRPLSPAFLDRAGQSDGSSPR